MTVYTWTHESVGLPTLADGSSSPPPSGFATDYTLQFAGGANRIPIVASNTIDGANGADAVGLNNTGASRSKATIPLGGDTITPVNVSPLSLTASEFRLA